MNYSFVDLDNYFYETLLDNLIKSYRKTVKRKIKCFNNDISLELTPITKEDPLTGEPNEYKCEIEYYLKIVFDFCVGKMTLNASVEIALEKLLDIYWDNYFVGTDKVEWHWWKQKKRAGFFLYYAQTKIKLYEGKKVKALELAVLSGFTNQYICELLGDGLVKGKKIKGEWVIENEEACRFLSNKKKEYYPGI